jgi:hypothetical protein
LGQDAVRPTDYKTSVSIFSHHDDDQDFGSFIESAEVPGPVFTETVDFATVRNLMRRDDFLRLRDRAAQLARERETA